MSRILLSLRYVSLTAAVGLNLNSKPKKNASVSRLALLVSTSCEGVQRRTGNLYIQDLRSLKDLISVEQEGEILIMPDGSKYRGELIDGQRNNHGESWDTKGHYNGDWANNVKEGYGVLKYNNGFVYEGEFSNDLPHGQGKVTLRNGEVLEGVFVNGELQGHEKIPEFGWSKVTFENGRVVEGDFTFISGDQRIFSGHGRETLPGKYVYEGDIVENKAEGSGTLTTPLYNTPEILGEIKQIVHGTFSNGTLRVLSKLTIVSNIGTSEWYMYPNGTEYVRHIQSSGYSIEGESKNGLFHGTVMITFPDGSVAKGMYYNNEMYGTWVCTESNGTTFTVNIPMSYMNRLKKWWEKGQ